MSYLDTLKSEAETRLKNLSAKVATLTRQLAELEKRADSEKDALTTAEETLVQLKSAAGAYLTDSPGAFDRFKTNLKRTTARVETLRESIQIFTTELAPGKARELAAAREKLANEFSALYVAARPAVEMEMARLLDQVIAERDAFVAAFEEIRKTFNAAPYGGLPPRVIHARLASLDRQGMGRPFALAFKKAAPATSPAVPVLARPTLTESPPTGEIRESATSEAPLPPDKALDVQDAAAESPTRDAAPLSPEANRARVLLRRSPTVSETPLDPAEDSPAPAENSPEAETVDLPPAVDAEVEAVLVYRQF